MKGECPGEIQPSEGTDVKYFNNYEKDNSQVRKDRSTFDSVP